MRTLLPVLLFGTLLAAATCSAADEPTEAEMLGVQIWMLRAEGSYAEAAEVAEELLELTLNDPETKPYQLVDARRLAEMLRDFTTLPDSAQRELARADSVSSIWAVPYHDRRYEELAKMCRRALEIRRRILGEDHPEIAWSLVNLGRPLEALGQLEEAESLYREGLERLRAQLGEEHPDVGKFLFWLADVVVWQNRDEEAESLYREALAVFRSTYGTEDDWVPLTPNDARDYETELDWVPLILNNIAHLLAGKGDYAQAEEVYREALELRRKILGPTHTYVAVTLGNLAWVMMTRGDLEGAEPLAREALIITRRRASPGTPVIASKLAVLGILLGKQGDLAGAEPLYREALEIARNASGLEPPHVAVHMTNLASLLRTKGDYDESEALYREALASYREFFGAEHNDVARTLREVGAVLADKGDHEASEACVEEALAMYRRLFGDDHPGVASCVWHLAVARERAGDYEEARSLYGEALAHYRRQLGEGHHWVASLMGGLSDVAWATGDAAGAESLLVGAAAAHDVARQSVGSGLARSMFAEPPHRKLAAVRLSLGDGEGAWPVAEKSLALALADLLREAEERQLTPAEAAHEDSLRRLMGSLEHQLAAFREAALHDTTGDAAAKASGARTYLMSVQAEWSALQRELAARHPVTEGEAFALDRVQSALSDGSAIIGWLDVEGGGEQHSWCYAIRDSGPVVWARAGASDRSESASAPPDRGSSFRRHLADPTTSGLGIRREAHGLWTERIEPLGGALEGATEIVVLPSGAMLGVPIEALVDREGTSVGERYVVSYSPSATIHTWLAERGGAESSGRMLLVGDPPFNEGQFAAMESGEQIQLASLPEELMTSELVRSALAGNDEALSALPRLGGTRAEVTAIGELSRDASILLGPDASERELVRLAESGDLSGYGVIHVATHALVDDEQPERSALVLSQVGLPDAYESALAGERIYDGLLSAKEIVRGWDLNADLVTLSACETGLGREVAGEGYVGFAHAFFQAGARSLLVSLWKVGDRATALLMRRFYENRRGTYDDVRDGKSGEPMSKARALQEAKRYLRQYEDESGRRPYDHPYYWSAFILMGERS